MPIRAASPASSMIGAILLSERGNVRTVVTGAETQVSAMEASNSSTITNREDPTAWGFWENSVEESQKGSFRLSEDGERQGRGFTRNLISGIVPIDALTEQNLASVETPNRVTQLDFARTVKMYEGN
jgi:hypothetical protein